MVPVKTSEKDILTNKGKSLHTLLDSSFSENITKTSSKAMKTPKHDNISSSNHMPSNIGRPLPKPVSGTETLTASYTQTFLREKLSKGSISLCNSLDDLQIKHAKKLTSSPMTQYLLSQSNHLNPSWNDLLKAERDQVNHSKTDLNLSESLISSFSTKADQSSGSSSTITTVSGSKGEEISLDATTDDVHSQAENFSAISQEEEKYTIDIYTVSRGSILLNIVEQAWIHSVIVSFCSFLKCMV